MTKGDIPKSDYFRVSNDWWDALIRCHMPGNVRQCLDYIIRMTYGWQRKEAEIPLKDFMAATGMKKPHVSRALKVLGVSKMVTVTTNGNSKPVTYSFNKYFEQWEPLVTNFGNQKRVTTIGNEVLPRVATKGLPRTVTVPIKEQTTREQLKNIPPISENKEKGNGKLIIPDWLDIEVWNELKKYRKAKFTPYAQRLAINKLFKLRADGHDPTEVIQQTILRGWSGLFPIKEDFNKKESIEEWTKRISQP